MSVRVSFFLLIFRLCAYLRTAPLALLLSPAPLVSPLSPTAASPTSSQQAITTSYVLHLLLLLLSLLLLPHFSEKVSIWTVGIASLPLLLHQEGP